MSWEKEIEELDHGSSLAKAMNYQNQHLARTPLIAKKQRSSAWYLEIPEKSIRCGPSWKLSSTGIPFARLEGRK